MKQTETRQEVVERQYIVAEFCDWCGRQIPPQSSYDVRDFELSFASGVVYPEGGSKSGWKVEDMCDECVIKLRTMLESAGIRVTPTETDY